MPETANQFSSTPYWWDDDRFKPDGLSESVDQLPTEVDVAIIGGGYTGLSAALTLARAGKNVTVLDKERPGWGCSGRNGGLIGPSFHKLGITGLKKLYGQAKMMAIMKESLAGLDFLVNFIREEKIDCDLRLCGRFRGASHAKHYATLERQTDEISNVLDFPASMVPKHEQSSEIGSERYYGGVVYHLDGMLQPALLMQGMTRKVTQAGARIFDRAPVSAISKESCTYTLTLGTKTIRAENIIVATNGYTDNTMPTFKRRLIPIRSAMIATEPLSKDLIQSLSPNMRCHGGTDRLVHYYRPSPDGRRLLFGGRAIGQGDQPLKYAPYLRRCMLDIYPQLSEVQISHAWSGVVAYTFDHVPHLGKIDGIHYAMGYCGSGVGRATYFGNKIAHKLLGDEQGRTAFDNLPFRGRPLYTGNPWFLPLMLRWHHLADRFGW